MSLLRVAVVATILAVGSVHGGLSRQRSQKVSVNPSSLNHLTPSPTASTPVDSDVADSQQAWAPQGYNGPLATPEIRGDGTLVDTPEVAAARVAHLAALEQAIASNPDMDDGHYDPKKYGDHYYGVDSHSDDLLNNILFYGTLANHQAVQEVQAKALAEATHTSWQAKNTAPSSGGYAFSAPAEQNKPYFGPLAMLQVLPTGFIADTLEVSAARMKHLSALAEAKAKADLWKAKHAQQAQHQQWS